MTAAITHPENNGAAHVLPEGKYFIFPMVEPEKVVLSWN